MACLKDFSILPTPLHEDGEGTGGNNNTKPDETRPAPDDMPSGD